MGEKKRHLSRRGLHYDGNDDGGDDNTFSSLSSSPTLTLFLRALVNIINTIVHCCGSCMLLLFMLLLPLSSASSHRHYLISFSGTLIFSKMQYGRTHDRSIRIAHYGSVDYRPQTVFITPAA